MTLEPGDVARDLFGPLAQAADRQLVELSDRLVKEGRAVPGEGSQHVGRCR